MNTVITIMIIIENINIKKMVVQANLNKHSFKINVGVLFDFICRVLCIYGVISLGEYIFHFY